ncbi:MAG: anhydro-N-acetylmuramic acid kinase [Chlorobi bacterium]|nr:anhydro-N-acetylmuramic acid kinase [Chlorobiota bacterium]
MVSPRQWLSRPRIVAGAMSGTSLDGVDAAVVRLAKHRDRIAIDLLGTACIEFPRQFRQALLRATEEPLRVAELADLGCVLMHYYNRALADAIACSGAKAEAIGIHGQTLWHQPESHESFGIECRTTFQLATPAIVAATFGVPVVSDFRTADVALGGHGAPLVPILDWELLRDPTHCIVALNIGGIANVTVIPPKATVESICAFDTGPGNVWIDAAMHRYWGKRYDDGGRTAAAGTLITPLAERLRTIEFIAAPPPKSTGRELFSRHTLEELLAPLDRAMVPAEDIVATLTWFTAWSIAENIRRYATDRTTIVVSGGGANNATLLSMLERELPGARIVRLSDYCGIPESAKEAVLMAYLAYRTLGGLASSVVSVTGAHRSAVLGSITPPP